MTKQPKWIEEFEKKFNYLKLIKCDPDGHSIMKDIIQFINTLLHKKEKKHLKILTKIKNEINETFLDGQNWDESDFDMGYNAKCKKDISILNKHNIKI